MEKFWFCIYCSTFPGLPIGLSKDSIEKRLQGRFVPKFFDHWVCKFQFSNLFYIGFTILLQMLLEFMLQRTA